MVLKYILVFSILFLISFVSAVDLEVGEEVSNPNAPIVSFEIPPPMFNNQTAAVNVSSWWNDLNTPADFFLSMFDVANWIDVALNLNGQNIIDVGSIVASQINSSFFNWTSGDDWNLFDGSTLIFNNTKISDLFQEIQIVYNATSIETSSGTLTSGNLASINKLADGDAYNVTEDSGADPLTISINFTGVINFNQVALRGKYNGGSGHEIEVEIWRVGTGWEAREDITDQTHYGVTIFPVFIGDNFIDGGLVRIRLFHENNGVTSHDYSLDAIFVGQVTGIVNPSDLGDLTGRENACELLPDVFCKDGSKNMTGTLNLGGKNITNADWITANNGNFTDISATGTVITPMVKSGSLEIDVTNGILGFGGGSPIRIDWLNGLLNSGNGNTILDFSTDGLADFKDNEIRTAGQISLSKVGENIITATNVIGDLRLGAGGGTNDLQITSSGNVIIFEDLQVVGDIKGNTLQSTAGTGDYIIGTSLIPASWSVQSQLTNNQARYGFYSKDGDGTDTVLLDIYLQGTPTDRTNEKRVVVGVSSVGEAVIATEGTPTLELTLRTQANTDQIRLMADGSVEMKSGDLSVTNGDLKIISDSNFLHFGEQIGDFNISFDSTNPIFNNQGGSSFIFKNGTGFGELIANEYSVATPIFDNYNGNLLSNLRTPNEMLFSGKLNRETLTDIEKGVKQIKDTNNCWDVIKEYCWTIDDEEYIYRNCEDVLPKEIIDYEIVYKEECGIKDLNVTGVAGVGLVNRLMISELFERIKFLEENCVLK